MSRNPLRVVFDVRKSELPLALLMSLYFFLVITTFWILKPLKKGLFIEHYDESGFALLGATLTGPQAELLAKVANMFVAFVAVGVFTWLATRLRRERLTLAFSAFFLASFAGYALAVGAPGGGTVWSFYLFGDLYSTVMVATFFAFLNDSVSADTAKRIYGLVGLGGVTGGVVGTTVLRALIERIPAAGLLLVCVAIAVVIAIVAYMAGRLVTDRPAVAEPLATGAGAAPKLENPLTEGGRLVFGSPYLLSIVGIVGLYEIVSTVMDFQFSSTVSHYLEGPAIGTHFATVFFITNVVSMLVQLFLTSFVMSRVGIGAALLVLPVGALAGSLGFLAAPVLWMGSALNTLDNAFSYSINQSAKEALYVPTTVEEKYKAKAFIDMFVQRFAKALAVGVSLLLSLYFTDFSSLRWLSVFSAATIAVWLVAARYAGNHFAVRTAATQGASTGEPVRSRRSGSDLRPRSRT